MAFETYGSFRVEFLYDIKGKSLKSDSLFLNIYDFWAILHEASLSMKCEEWCHPKVAKLEQILRKKWKTENAKDLPIINVLLKNIKEEKLVFIPVRYLNDEEQYFANLTSWKMNFEKQLLEKYPFLMRPPIRHKKIKRKPKYYLPR